MSAPVSPQDTAERVLELAAAAGADSAVALVEESSEANLRWAGSTLTTNGVMRSRTVTAIVVRDGAAGASVGSVTGTRAGEAALQELVAEAAAQARANGPAEDAAPLLGPGAAAGGDWSAGVEETGMAVFAGLAPALGEVFREGLAAGREMFGFAEHALTTTYLATSTGLRLRHAQPTGKIELTGKAERRTTSSWVGQATRDFTDIDVAALDAELARRLAWARRRVDLPAGRYETLLPPSAVADLMVYLYWSAGARDAHDGRTVFSRPGGGTRVGDTLTDVPLTLRSAPQEPGLVCQPFATAVTSGEAASVFDNGLPLGPVDWIRDGRLAALLQTRHTAELTGLPLTPAVDNLVLEGPAGGRDLDAMIAGTDRGLLVTCLWYIREVDPQSLLLTGLTRDGVLLVEGGEVAGVVTNYRWNESPVDLLARTTEVGSTAATLPREWGDYFTRAAMPALRIPDFNMSTVSRAL